MSEKIETLSSQQHPADERIVERHRDRIIEMLETADKTERILEENIIALTALSQGTPTIRELPDESQIAHTGVIRDEQWIVLNNGNIIQVMPVYDSKHNKVSSINFVIEDTEDTQKLSVTDKISLVKKYQQNSPSPEPSDWLVSHMDQDKELLGYDLDRVVSKQRARKLVELAADSAIEGMHTMLFRPEEKLILNSNRHEESLNKYPKNFESNTDYLDVFVHANSNPQRVTSLQAAKRLDRAAYPNGFENHVIDTLQSGDIKEAERIVALYNYGKPDENSKEGNHYPSGSRLRVWDLLAGNYDTVFLAPEFSAKVSYANPEWGAQQVYRYTANELEQKGATCLPAEISMLYNQRSASTVTDYYNHVYEQAGAEIMKLSDFRTYFKHYCERVFDSQQSMETFFDTFSIKGEYEKDVFKKFDTKALSTAELDKIKYLYDNEGLVPPFLMEVYVKKELPIAQEISDE